MEAKLGIKMESQEEISYWRQYDIFRANNRTRIVIIGAGGIGSWVSLCLSKEGFKSIEVWDGDIIEAHNRPSQYFSKNGINKAEELARTIPNVTAIPRMWDGETLSASIVVLAVDNMEIRKRIVETQKASLIIDGRIGGEFIRVLSVSPVDFGSKEYYLDSWYPSEEASKQPCTARSIADVGFLITFFIVSLIRQFLANSKVTREIMYDIRLQEMMKITTEFPATEVKEGDI